MSNTNFVLVLYSNLSFINYYKVPKQEYINLLLKSIRKVYKNNDKNILNNINKKEKKSK